MLLLGSRYGIGLGTTDGTNLGNNEEKLVRTDNSIKLETSLGKFHKELAGTKYKTELGTTYDNNIGIGGGMLP